MEMKFSNDARNSILNGVEKLTKAVASTLGPAGRNVIVQKNGKAHITKDGATVAEFIKLDDVYENVGADIVREVALKTAEVAGDGTTTSTILANEILRAGIEKADEGVNVRHLKHGIDIGVKEAIRHIKLSARQVEDADDLCDIATISANGDTEVASLVTEAVVAVGKDGIITVEATKGTEDSIDIVTGLEFNRGYMSPYFMTNQMEEVSELENPLILLSEERIGKIETILPTLETAKQSGRPLLIIASDIDNNALATLILNHIRGNMRICVVKTPGFGDKRAEYLQDIALITGATAISKTQGTSFEKVTFEMLGSADKIVVGREKSLIIGGRGDKEKINEVAVSIKTAIENAPTDDAKELLRTRLARLGASVAVIRLGAKTELELMEKKDRVDDAVAATRAVEESGFVIGGGQCLFDISQTMRAAERPCMNKEENLGYNIILDAIQKPFRQILENANVDVCSVIREIAKKETPFHGFDVITTTMVDMDEQGVIDPAKVVFTALQNATSVAGLLLTTECIVPPEEKKEASSMPMEMM